MEIEIEQTWGAADNQNGVEFHTKQLDECLQLLTEVKILNIHKEWRVRIEKILTVIKQF